MSISSCALGIFTIFVGLPIVAAFCIETLSLFEKLQSYKDLLKPKPIGISLGLVSAASTVIILLGIAYRMEDKTNQFEIFEDVKVTVTNCPANNKESAINTAETKSFSKMLCMNDMGDIDGDL